MAPHQALVRAPRHRHPVPRQLPPDLVRPVDLYIGPPDPLDRRHQQFIAFGTGAAPMRLAPKGCMPAISRRGDLQDLADRLDPESTAMFVDEAPQDLSRRSSSAWAKNALDRKSTRLNSSH